MANYFVEHLSVITSEAQECRKKSRGCVYKVRCTYQNIPCEGLVNLLIFCIYSSFWHVCNFSNSQAAEISMTWLVEQSAIKWLVFCDTREKQTLRSLNSRQVFLIPKTRKNEMFLSYHSSNLSLTPLTIMRLLVTIWTSIWF